MMRIINNFIFRLIFTQFDFIHIVDTITRGRILYLILDIFRLNTEVTDFYFID